MNKTAPRLSVVIPAFNEEIRILPTLERVFAFLESRKIDHEVLVVDDGSTDETAELVRRFSRDRPQLQLLNQPQNLGKGAAVKAGALEAKGEYILFSDADLSTDISEVDPFLESAERGADIVIGSRVLPGSKIVGWNPWYRILSGRTFNRIIRIVALPGISDTQCGFKMFSRQAALEIFPLNRISGFGFDVELLFIGRHLGFTLEELPITWNNARNSKINLMRHTFPMLADVLAVRRNSWKGKYGARRPLA